MREILHEDAELTVALTIDDDGVARVELLSAEGGPDLTTEDEVVVVMEGEGCPLEVESPRRALATLGDAEALEAAPLTLMVRVFEFFEGWEFFADEEE